MYLVLLIMIIGVFFYSIKTLESLSFIYQEMTGKNRKFNQ